jgi:hypothetical protein|tara:strand:+ start:15 stop:362 length:348 start_codon:yes stop_codon:yes gene_type:complete
MKLARLNKEQRQICMKAYANKTGTYEDKNFVDTYLQFCKASDYEDISAENFLVYMKIYGTDSPQKDRQFNSVRSDGGRMFTHNRMIKGEGSEKTIESFIEENRIKMMRRMRNANR